MASVETVNSNYSRYFEQNYCVSERESCEHCLSMRDYMQVPTSELKSTQLIVKILQDELKSKVPEPTISGITTTCVNFKPQDTINSESESAWIEPRGNNHKAKLPKNTTRYLKHITPHIPLGKKTVLHHYVPCRKKRYNPPIHNTNYHIYKKQRVKNNAKSFFLGTAIFVDALANWQIS